MGFRFAATRTKARSLTTALLCALAASAHAQKTNDTVSGAQTDLAAARQELAAKHYARAKELYRAYLQAHPGSVDAEFGVVEAELGRWDEFERERAVLRAARERGAPGISAHESDVIDSFEVNGHRWIVREYYEPAGRSQTRYNFERFSPDGHAEEYISLEPTAAAEAALKPGDVHIGAETEPARHSAIEEFSLNWYSGKGHGTIARYPKGEPTYEEARSDLRRWLRQKP